MEIRCWSISRTYCNSPDKARINRVSCVNLTKKGVKPQGTADRCCNLARFFVDNTTQHFFRFDSLPKLVKTDAVVESKVAMTCVRDSMTIWLTANLFYLK